MTTIFGCSKKKDIKFPLQGQYLTSEFVFSDSTRIVTMHFDISSDSMIESFLQSNNVSSQFYQNASIITLKNFVFDFKDNMLQVSSSSSSSIGTNRLLEHSSTYEKFENNDTIDVASSPFSSIELLNNLYLDTFYTSFYYIPFSSGFEKRVKIVPKSRIYKIDGEPYLSFIRYAVKRNNSFLMTHEMNAFNPNLINYLGSGDTLVYKTYYQKLISVE